VNLALLAWFAHRAGLFTFEADLVRSVVRLLTAGLVLALVLWLAHEPVRRLFAGRPAENVATLVVLGAVGAVTYAALVLVLFGRRWLAEFRRRRAAPPQAERR
jgi:putative peptidoglycan lipid II flippase